MRRLVRCISLGSLSVLALAAMAVPLGLGGPDLAAGDTARLPRCRRAPAGVQRAEPEVQRRRRRTSRHAGAHLRQALRALHDPDLCLPHGFVQRIDPECGVGGDPRLGARRLRQARRRRRGRRAGRRIAAAGAHAEAGRVARRQGDRVGRARHRVQVQGQGGGAAVPRRRPRHDRAARRHEGPLLGRRRQHALGDRPIRSEPVGHRLRCLHGPGGPVRRAPPAGGGGCLLPGVRPRRDGSG